MHKLPWYFIWSDKYADFADILSSIISDKYFDLYPIEISQEVFDRTIYQEGKHFLSGMFIKDYEIYKILQNIEEDAYFIFSDVDVIAFEDELHEYLVPFLENRENNDIVFYKENETSINVCFMLIKNTKKVRDLYESIIQEHKIHKHELDGYTMNKMLKLWDGKYGTFSSEYVSSTINMNMIEKNFKNICVFAASCTAFDDYRLNNIEKLLSYKHLFNLDVTEYIESLIEDLDENKRGVVQRLKECYLSKDE